MTGLPQGWASVALRDVVDSYDTVDPQRTPDQRFAYVDIGAIDNSVQKITDPKEFLGKDAPSRARRVIRTGDVLFSTVRTYLKNVAQVPPELEGQLTSTGICVLRANAATDPDYLFRWACSSDFINEISQAQDGTMYPAVRDEDVLAGPIPLPPLPEQRRIVRKLDTLSARSSTARTHLTAIEKLVERYKSGVLIKVFSDAATSDKMTTLDKVGKLLCGQSPASATVNRHGIGTPYCTGPEQWDGTSIHLDKWTTDPKRFIDVESIFITVKGSGVGTLFPGTKCAIGRDVYAYVPDQDKLEWRFAFWALRYEIASILINVKGLIPGLSKPDILDNPVYVPSLDEQREIVRRIETAFAKIDRLAAEAAKALKLLGHLDQRILAKAFAGDLVPQDPTDEPAETLLARINEALATAPKGKRGRRAKA